MTAREFEKHTEFKRIESPESMGATVIARFEARRSVFIHDELLRASYLDDTMKRVKKDLLLKLMSDVYQSRQRDLIEATAEFLSASPYGLEYVEARNNVVAVALRQPDATIDTLLKVYKDEILQSTKPE